MRNPTMARKTPMMTTYAPQQDEAPPAGPAVRKLSLDEAEANLAATHARIATIEAREKEIADTITRTIVETGNAAAPELAVLRIERVEIRDELSDLRASLQHTESALNRARAASLERIAAAAHSRTRVTHVNALRKLDAFFRTIPTVLEAYGEWAEADREHREACSALSVAAHDAYGRDRNADHPAEDTCSYSAELAVGLHSWAPDDVRRQALADMKRWYATHLKEVAEREVRDAA
jgi:hypothetical protein